MTEQVDNAIRIMSGIEEEHSLMREHRLTRGSEGAKMRDDFSSGGER